MAAGDVKRHVPGKVLDSTRWLFITEIRNLLLSHSKHVLRPHSLHHSWQHIIRTLIKTLLITLPHLNTHYNMHHLLGPNIINSLYHLPTSINTKPQSKLPENDVTGCDSAYCPRKGNVRFLFGADMRHIILKFTMSIFISVYFLQ